MKLVKTICRIDVDQYFKFSDFRQFSNFILLHRLIRHYQKNSDIAASAQPKLLMKSCQ